jgi:polyisoprenyl-teichoic acid--peptidoglycan teichoic acid transferase
MDLDKGLSVQALTNGQRFLPSSPVGQAALAVLIGALAGFALLLFSGKVNTIALFNTQKSGQQLAGSSNSTETGLNALAMLPPLERRMNVLLMGVDSNGADTQRFVSTRSDTMILVSVDPVSKKVGMLSIPRDTKVEISGGRGTNKLNAAHALGGPELAMTTVRESLGLPIDHYVVIDAKGLKLLFEQLGPVEVLVEKNMRYHDHTAHLNIDLQPGLQWLTPLQAEEYVRYRHDARGDIGRIERQQWFLRQIAKQLKQPQMLFKLPQLVQFARDYVVTDLSLDEMARMLSFFKDYEIGTMETATLPGGPATISGCSYWLADLDATRVISDRLLGTYSYTQPAADLNQAALAGNVSAAVDKPFSMAIRYPRGFETLAADMELQLKETGFKFKYKYAADPSDCQHQQIIQMSARADDQTTGLLQKSLPKLSTWPVTLAVESRPSADFTLVLSPPEAISSTATSSVPVEDNSKQAAQ